MLADPVARASIALLFALAGAALGTCVVSMWLSEPRLVLAAATLAAMLAAALAWRASLQPSCTLRWDGTQWWLRTGQEAAPGRAGRVRAMIDLGDWMLLRFDAEGVGDGRPAVPKTVARPHAGRARYATAGGRYARPKVRWLPVARRQRQATWHALRVAVHAPAVRSDAPAPPRD